MLFFKKRNVNAVYVKMSVHPEELAEFISLAKLSGIKGVSVTIPLKEKILPFLDQLEISTKEIGATNTLSFKNESIHAINTDGFGTLNAIEKRMTVKGKTVVLLGAGGAARSIAFEAKSRGAKLFILNRTLDRARQLAEELKCQAGTLDEIPTSYDILINCSPEISIDPKKFSQIL